MQAADPLKIGMTVQLPPFIVEQTAGPPWRYYKTPRFEILSRCKDPATDRLALAFARAAELLDVVLPTRFQGAMDVPKALIFYDEKLWPVSEQNAVAAMLQALPSAGAGERGRSAPRDELVPVTRAQLLGIDPPRATGRGRFFANLGLTDVDCETTFALVSPSWIDPREIYLTPEYVEHHLRGCVPGLPAWLISGFVRVYSGLDFLGDKLILKPAKWESKPESFVDAAGATQWRGFLLLEDFLDEQALEKGADRSIWLAQAELFVRWGIDPAGGNRVQQFWDFVARTSAETPSEKVFQECFGISRAEATRQLAAYATEGRTLRWKLAKETELPSTQLRDATPGEVARIKGEWERLETQYIRTEVPDLEATYLVQARRTLHRGLDRGDQDPRLLATLGLLELDADNKVPAREYLEQAVAQAVVRPRAYFELAQQRYDHLRGRSTRDDGKLSAEQVNTILDPLLAATRQAPLLPQVYELMAEVCANCAAPPPAAALAALNEGVKLFPQDSELAYRMAVLYANERDSTQARSMIKAGLEHANDAALRARLLKLNRKLLAK